MTARTYEIYLPGAFRVWFLIMAIITIGMPILVLVTTGQPGGPPWPVAVLFPGVMGIVWVMVLRTPHRIEVHADERIEFVAVLRRRIVPVSDIFSVRPHRTQFGWLVIRYSGGRIAIANQFTGFHQLLSELAQRNPGAELLGC